MSLESATTVYEKAQHSLESYQRFLSETVNYLTDYMYHVWSDDVGQCAIKSLGFVSRGWYSAVSRGIGEISSALQTIREAYHEMAVLNQRAEEASHVAQNAINSGE